MKTLKRISLCLLSFVLLGCVEESEKYIRLINKLDRNVVFQAGSEKSFTEDDIPYECQGLIYTIFKDSSYLLHSLDDTGWEADFNFRPCMTFLFMDEEALDKYFNEPCDTIRKYVPVLHLYQVSVEDMRRSNWTIVYPPEE